MKCLFCYGELDRNGECRCEQFVSCHKHQNSMFVAMGGLLPQNERWKELQDDILNNFRKMEKERYE